MKRAYILVEVSRITDFVDFEQVNTGWVITFLRRCIFTFPESVRKPLVF